MKRFIKSKKGFVLLATLVVAAVAAFGAYAYLTTGGSGSGSASAGSTTNNLMITPVTVGSGLLPGQSVAVSYSINNPNTYSVVVSGVTGATMQSNGSCDNSFFSYSDAAGNNFPQTIAPGATLTGLTGTLSEADSPTINQDACTFNAPYNNSTTLNLTSS